MNENILAIKNELENSDPDIKKIQSLFKEVLSGSGSGENIFNHTNDHFEAEDESINLYDALASNIPRTNVFIVDKEMKVIYAHGREMEEYGFARIHYEGKLLTDLWSDDEAAALKPLYAKALTGRRSADEFESGDDAYRITIIPLRSKSGMVNACMSIITNITSTRKKEQDLKEAKNHSESANEAKSEFMANMSHEIRTPLNSVIGFTEQLAKTTLDNEQRRFLNMIEDASEHLLSLVNEILILMKIGSGSLYIERIPFSVKRVFEQSINFLKIKAKKKGLSFESTLANNVPEVLVGDPVRFKQIMINLLSNAIKFTDFGYVRSEIRAYHDKNRKLFIELKVKDSGIGIDKEELDLVFNAFGQSDTSATRKYGGSGLGLTIVKELVELQGGSIVLKSSKGRGSTFTVKMPFETGSMEDIEEEDHIYEFNTSLISHFNVLLVDDDETNRLLAKTILSGWKVKFEEASEGKTALDKLSKHKYDLVLMDIHMPEMSGTDVVKQVRKDKRHINNATKFVAVTANIVKSDLKSYRDAGMDDHLIKPYREEALFNKICKVMNIDVDNKIDVRGQEGQSEMTDGETEKPYDLHELISVSKGDIIFFNKTLKSYIEAAENVNNTIQKLYESSQIQLLGEKAHKLISSSRFLGLSSIANLCVQIEDGTLNGYEHDIPNLVDQLISRLDKVVPMLKNEYISN